jgi:hypothetical protein
MIHDDIPGVKDLRDWGGADFGFHDSEVEAIDLTAHPDRCVISIHAWRTRSELDERGNFVTDAHVTVRFVLEGIIGLTLDDWKRQNVLFGLDAEPTARGYAVTLDSSFGVGGRIEAKSLRLEITHRGN